MSDQNSVEPSITWRDIDFDAWEVNGQEIEFEDGTSILVRVERDDFMGKPWQEHADGHGIVSDWTSRSKRPGELILCTDRGSHRFYDFSESVRIALRDGWDNDNGDCCDNARAAYRRDPAVNYAGDFEHSPECPRLNGESARARAARAARADYEYLRAWCRDEWQFVSIQVQLIRTVTREVIAEDSLGGVESWRNYWRVQAAEMAQMLIAEHERRVAHMERVSRENAAARYAKGI